jgi:hypothetical protein
MHWRKTCPGFAVRIDGLRAANFDHRTGNFQDKDFIQFRKHYFNYDTFYHQGLIIEAIEKAGPASVTMILVPPEHGKTTVIEDYCNYRIAKDPNVRITIGSEGQPHARKILRRIASRMEDSTKAPNYIGAFGPFRDKVRQLSKPWTADYLTVLRADHDERDYTLEARGWRSAIAGTRTDLMILDDIQSKRSLNFTDAMVETIRQDWLTRPGKDGAVIIVGTRVGIGDFYEKMIEAEIVDRIIELPAINADGDPLCPDMWPIEALKRKRKQVGEDAWWRNYMQTPRRAGSQAFTAEMVEGAFDIGRAINEKPAEVLDVVVSIDPALTGNCAFGVYGYNSREFFLLDTYAINGIGTIAAICAQVEMICATHRPSVVIVESNAFQRGLVYDETLQALGRRYGFRIIDHATHRNKLDEDIGVARIPTSFISGQISIPWADDATRLRITPFLDELYNWRPHIKGTRLRQDMVMTLWFAWLYWRRWCDTNPEDPVVLRRKGLPWRPTANFMRAKVTTTR